MTETADATPTEPKAVVGVSRPEASAPGEPATRHGRRRVAPATTLLEKEELTMNRRTLGKLLARRPPSPRCSTSRGSRPRTVRGGHPSGYHESGC